MSVTVSRAAPLSSGPSLGPAMVEPSLGPVIAGEIGYERDLDELLTRLVAWFEEAENASEDARENAERDREYYCGVQWTQAEVEELRKRGQPVITINKISEKIQLLCGLERRNRSDPKAFPRTPTEEERADAATQALRYIADDNTFDVIRSAVYEEMLVEGFGGVELSLEDDGQGGANVLIRHVPWDRIWFDPHARQLDFTDARYKGLVLWMDKDQLDELYPTAADVIADAFSVENSGNTYDDRPDHVNWSDSRRHRVRVVQCHWQEAGEWWSATIAKAGFLAEPQRSPFLDRRGRSCCPLILESAYVDRHNNRYGVVRGLISLQDEINKRRSKSLHLLSVRQTIAEQGAVKDVDKAKREVARPDGYVEINPGFKFEIQPGGDLAVGQFQLLQHATQEMQQSGPNAAMAGVAAGDPSGRAIIAEQAAGAAANAPLSDNLRQWTRRVYETAWMAARQYWTAGKWVRVTDDIGTVQWVGINRPVTVRDELAAMPEQQRAMAMQQLQLVPGDPRLEQVIRIENDITDLEVDITIEEGMDVPALEHEQFTQLAQLAQAQPGLIPPDVLIAASGLRNKQVLLDRMKQAQEAAGQTGPQMQQLEVAKKAADVRATNAKAMADEALAKERDHAAIHHIADVHSMYRAPPDSASPPNPDAMAHDQTLPPEIIAANALADIEAKAAKVRVDDAKARDLHFASVKKAAETRAILHPPPQQQQQ